MRSNANRVRQRTAAYHKQTAFSRLRQKLSPKENDACLRVQGIEISLVDFFRLPVYPKVRCIDRNVQRESFAEIYHLSLDEKDFNQY